MRARLFFVTYVVLLAIAGLAASRVYQSESLRQASLVREGNAKLGEIRDVQEKLTVRFGIEFEGRSEPDWKMLSKAERREVQSEVAHLLSLINRVLEIDAKKNITIENRTPLLISRDSAESVQKSVENFESMYGENFDPKHQEPSLHTSNDSDGADEL
jgi:hypothetical protein